MTSRVLVAVDDSPLGRKAFAFALETYPDAELVALHVLDPIDMVYVESFGGSTLYSDLYETAEREAEALFAELDEVAAAHGVEYEAETVLGDPGNAIVDYVEEHDVDHLVMGSHGRTGVSRVLLGSVAESVMRRAPVPVTVVR